MITNVNEFDTNKMVFLKPKDFDLHDAVIFKRMPIRVLNNSKLQPLFIATKKCFSKGIQKDQSSLKLPITLFDTCPTEEQKEFYDTFKKIIEACKDHCAKNGFYNVDKMSSCLFTKNESCPILYAKVPSVKGEVSPNFYEIENVQDAEEAGQIEKNPESLIGQRMNVKVLLNLDHIYISRSCISLQVKVHEANFSKITEEFKRKRLMSNAVAKPKK